MDCDCNLHDESMLCKIRYSFFQSTPEPKKSEKKKNHSDLFDSISKKRATIAQTARFWVSSMWGAFFNTKKYAKYSFKLFQLNDA